MKTIRIGLLWHSAASGNFGVGALTVGNIALARAAAARAGLTPQFMVFAPVEPADPYISGPDIAIRKVNRVYLTSISGYRADLATLDIMLDISAGDSFADIYPEKRFIQQVMTKILAIVTGKPLILSPQTIGPFSRQPHSAIAGWIANRARLVFARDPISMAVIKRLAPRARAQQVVDVAFALPHDAPAPRTDTRIRVGMNVSGLLMNGGWTGNNQYGLTFDYAAVTRALVKAFLAMPDVDLYMVPHVVSPELPQDDDMLAADRLKAEFPALIRCADFTSPSTAKSFIAGLDFMIGGRMHATIAAYSTGVPVVPISYSPKFEGLYGGLNYPWLVPAKGMDTDTAIAFVLDAFANRDRLAADIPPGLPIIAQGLENYTAGLAEQFSAAMA